MNHNSRNDLIGGRWGRAARVVVLCAAGWCLGQTSLAAEPVDLDTDAHLTAWWKFDEDSGTEAADSSKHDHDGELAGGMTFDDASVPGRIGKALEFDGRDDLVEVPGYKGVTATAARTVSAWLKTKTSQGDLVSWGKDDFGQMWIVRFIRGHVGVTPNGGYLYMAERVDDGQWHHVAIVVRKAELPNLHDDVTIYLDGKVAEIDRIGLLDLWPIETGDEQDVAIGRRFAGTLDDVRIYDRALSEDEVARLHGAKK